MLTPIVGSATIGSTEYFLVSASTTATYQTTQGRIRYFIDLSAMAAGDQYQIAQYRKVNGGTARVTMLAYPTGAQSTLWASEEFSVTDGWEIGIKKTQGTDRSIAWSIDRMNGDAIATSVWAATTAGNVTAGTFGLLVGALPSAASIATAVLAATYEGARTVQGFFRIVRAALINKASGLEGTPLVFRDDADTKNRLSFAMTGGAGENVRTPTIDET